MVNTKLFVNDTPSAAVFVYEVVWAMVPLVRVSRVSVYAPDPVPTSVIEYDPGIGALM
jgi:hypothetical protein